MTRCGIWKTCRTYRGSRSSATQRDLAPGCGAGTLAGSHKSVTICGYHADTSWKNALPTDTRLVPLRAPTLTVTDKFSASPASIPALGRPTAQLLVIKVPTITSTQTNAEVLQMFGRHRELISLPVLENDRPIGLISRNIFMSQMSKPYYRELYEKKSSIAFMDKSPLIVEADTPIETLAARAVESGYKTLADGFMIVDEGRFLGVGAGLDLMHVLAELQAEKNRQIMQSIDYASTIQRAMLSESLNAIHATLSDVGIVWAPRDVIGGDFYHFRRYDDGWFAAIADCTGHGVPGAFLTLIASSSLTHALNQHGPRDPARLMAEVSRSIKLALGQHSATHHADSNDGMDAAFFWFEDGGLTLTSAHANMPLFLLSPTLEEVRDIEGERTGLGYAETRVDMAWTNQRTELAAGAILCCCTDGLIDQIGGPKNISYGKRRLRQALRRHRGLSIPDLTQQLMEDFQAYQGTHTRRDDLTALILRLDCQP
ncbi:SpoIIE family protein phosphatase [Alcaligenaceae bacterium]|nr:SpoIIE family protein phosphatase [Alcaligenaceae bacterium]